MRFVPVLLAWIGFAVLARAADDQTVFRYMGVKWCTGCHSRESSNPKLRVFHSWEGSAHAKAWEVLPEEDRANPACLKCHTTGYGMPWRSETTAEDLRGVQCEACHGPGSHYYTWNVMKSRPLALSRGLWLPTREVCAKCHY
ncbi:MAG: cytochrome c family protein [Deltaproteobacteria bacterium]|nr:cytochrome c family protein [Deltaproteobacteria bacterium]